MSLMCDCQQTTGPQESQETARGTGNSRCATRDGSKYFEPQEIVADRQDNKGMGEWDLGVLVFLPNKCG